MTRKALTLLVLLAACGTPQERCINGVTRDLRTVDRLIEEAEGHARTILTEHLDDLHTISKALLEYETLSNDEIGQILRGEKIVRDDTGGAGPERRRRASVPTSSGQDTGTAPGGANPEPQPGV